MGLGDCFDVIVIGAGPAGSMAARECARQGLRTTIIEKDRIPRSKPCGGGVSSKALKLIGTRISDDLIERYVKGFRFFSPSLDFVNLTSNTTIGISTFRDKFDAFLTKLAVDQGCELTDSDEVIDMSVLRDKVVCVLRSGRVVEGCMVIGADGANGITARITGIRERWERNQVGLCLETTIALDKERLEDFFDPEIFELYFINIPLGYGWVFPKKSSLSLGIGGCLAYIEQPLKILTDFCSTVSKLKKIDIKIPQFRAHLAPSGGFQRKIVSDKVLLVGDAAGFIDPLTGEGIYYAMKSGLVSANACVRAINENNTSASFLETHYSKICEKEIERDLRIALDLTYKIHDHFATFFTLLRSSSGSYWAALARGETSYSMLRRKLLPRIMVQLLSRRLQRTFARW